MAAPKGNQFWLARSKHGPNPKFDNDKVLWEACCEYFQWVEDNPLQEAIVYQGLVSEKHKSLMRAMTESGLCIFLDISTSSWGNYRNKSADFLSVCEGVENVIRTQKFQGAAADLLNPAIIARDLGLTDGRAPTENVNLKVDLHVNLEVLSEPELERLRELITKSEVDRPSLIEEKVPTLPRKLH